MGRGLPERKQQAVPGLVCVRRPICECAYHVRGRGRRCKHIAVVEQLLAISSEPAPGGHTVIKEQEVKCPECNRKDYTRDGVYRGRYEDKQRYKCLCGKRFRDNLGVEYRQMPRRLIRAILMLYGRGCRWPTYGRC